MTRPQFAPRHPSPSPDDIRVARSAAGHSQSQAAEVARATLRSWQAWEAGERRMPAGLWELYRIKTGQIAVG